MDRNIKTEHWVSGFEGAYKKDLILRKPPENVIDMHYFLNGREKEKHFMCYGLHGLFGGRDAEENTDIKT